MNTIKPIFILFAILLASSPYRLIASNDDYTLVWNEDFTDTTLDRNVWNIEVNGDGGGNNELQYYCEKGVTLDIEPTTGKRCLVLTATKEDYKSKKCTSGRVNTKNNLYYTFGKIEARIKFPNTANGLWPAFWQMGNDFDQVGWPRCGETDIIELGNANGINRGTQDRYFNGALHLGSAWNTVWCDAQDITYPYSVEDTFHIVTMIWTPTSIDMYMDRDANPGVKPYFHADLEPNNDANYDRSRVFAKPNFIIANLAVGGNFPQIWDITRLLPLPMVHARSISTGFVSTNKVPTKRLSPLHRLPMQSSPKAAQQWIISPSPNQHKKSSSTESYISAKTDNYTTL